MSYVKTKSKQKPFRVSAFKKIDEKISFALPKYGSSRFVFRFFGSLECSRLRNSFCPPAHSEPRTAWRGQNSVRAIFRIHRQLGKCKFGEVSSRRVLSPPGRVLKGVFWGKGKGFLM